MSECEQCKAIQLQANRDYARFNHEYALLSERLKKTEQILYEERQRFGEQLKQFIDANVALAQMVTPTVIIRKEPH